MENVYVKTSTSIYIYIYEVCNSNSNDKFFKNLFLHLIKTLNLNEEIGCVCWLMVGEIYKDNNKWVGKISESLRWSATSKARIIEECQRSAVMVLPRRHAA